MPALNAFPGLSPICCVVRVQMEHCAFVFNAPRLRKRMISIARFLFVLILQCANVQMCRCANAKVEEYTILKKSTIRCSNIFKVKCLAIIPFAHLHICTFAHLHIKEVRFSSPLLSSASSGISSLYLHPVWFYAGG